MFVALQMLAGGVGLLAVALVAGETFSFDWTPRAFLAFLWLTSQFVPRLFRLRLAHRPHDAGRGWLLRICCPQSRPCSAGSCSARRSPSRRSRVWS